MSNPAPITLAALFRYWRGLPHQAAAIGELEADLQANGYAVAMRRDRLWFHTWSTDGKQADTAWLAPALQIVKEFEGCRLQAYRCPAGVWTIGWGATAIGGRPVVEGQAITQQQADQQLTADLQRFHAGVLEALPIVASWAPHRQAALVSWAFNVGVGAVRTSTLRQRLLAANDPPAQVISEELPRWNKADGKVLPGLARRRAAEVRLFLGHQPQPAPAPATPPVAPPAGTRNPLQVPYYAAMQISGLGSGGYAIGQQPAPVPARPPVAPRAGTRNPLQVPYYAQLDSSTDQARRMCFSSSCAMLLAFLRPGILHGFNGDDQYLARVRKFGDTTSATAQVQALGSYEVRADFTKKADFADLERQIDAGFPVPCGYLHRGPVDAPSGGGHWLIVVGYDATDVIVHDPLGEADLVTGATLPKPARFCRYSKQNFGRRWMIEGPGSGWAIVVRR